MGLDESEPRIATPRFAGLPTRYRSAHRRCRGGRCWNIGNSTPASAKMCRIFAGLWECFLDPFLLDLQMSLARKALGLQVQ